MLIILPVICVKSNPNNIKYAFGVDNNTEFTLMQEKPETYLGKDVSLMSKDATYSNAIKVEKDFYLQKGIKDILKIEIKEKEVKQETKTEYQTSLFD